MMNYTKDEHDYSGVGINPMYNTAGGQSIDNTPNTYIPLSPPSSTTQPSEYDEINNGHSRRLSSGRYVTRNSAAPPPSERKITSNSLYASHNAALLRHPTLGPYESTRSCDMMLDEEFEKDESRYKCVCSPDLALFVGALLVIILSVMAITLSLLLQFGVINSSNNNNPSVTTITLTNSTNNNNSTAAPINSNNTNFPPNQTQVECDCQFSVSTMNLLESNFTDISNSILRIMEGLERLRVDQNISVIERMQLLSIYLTRIKSINESLQQLRPQANQLRHPILSGLNHTAGITVNYDDCTDSRLRCQMDPFSFGLPGACQTTPFDYASETHIVIATFGSLVASQPLTNITIATMQVNPHSGEEFLPNESTFERLKKADIYYLCFNFNPFMAYCDVYFRRCSYQTNLNVTASISFYR